MTVHSPHHIIFLRGNMGSQVEIAVPGYSVVPDPKPHIAYNISLRLPLRSFSIQKRYSDFTDLHSFLTSQTGATPPFSLPSKSYFTSSTSLELAETRRHILQDYLTGINTANDGRWRNTSAWRTFLNLPSNTTTRSNTATNLHSARTSSSTPTDPIIWLDTHRELKSELHSARLAITKRDQASTAQSQHEAAADAKKYLVRAGTLVKGLEEGLQAAESGQGSSWGVNRMGEGEVRRRRDVLSSATREKEGLENLLSAMAAKSALDRTVASVQEKKGGLIGEGAKAAKGKGGGRVLGRETGRTKELDNQGVVMLQQQLMKEQDEDVTVLAQAVSRQKELGIQIQEELAVQADMLNLLDEDVDRVQGKIDVARKRIDKIS